jgi:hypothetical protein
MALATGTRLGAAEGRRFVVARTITRRERHAVLVENWLTKAE